MDELLAQFIVEARELVQAAIDDLFVLETDSNSPGRLDGAFRAVHTLKGSVGLFDLPALQRVLHRAEDNLGQVRSGGAVLDAGQIDAIVAVLEWIDACVDDMETGGAVGPSLLARAGQLEAALEFGQDEAAEPAAIVRQEGSDWAVALAAPFGDMAHVALRYRPDPGCFFNGDDPLALVSQVPQLLHVAVAPREPWPDMALFDPFRANLEILAVSGASVDEVAPIFRLVPDQVEIVALGTAPSPAKDDAEPGATARPGAGRTLRIDPERIDALLDTAGELMTAKNGISQLVATANALAGGEALARAIAATQKDLDRLVAGLYGAVLQTRMVPLSQAFTRLPRLVRDLSRRLGKPAELTVKGDALEADRTIVDGLFEPLLHLVRNAMDHGIEASDDRLTAGKPATGKLFLQAEKQGDRIVITLSDDGRGIDPDAIRAAAVQKGLVSAAQAAALNDSAALELLFAAGFSTAASVSDISGRGVGLDAVRSDIEQLGGSVQLASQKGLGTSTTLVLPASFSLSQLLVVEACGERYGVPLQAVVETVRISARAITPIRSNRAFVLRDRTVPLLSLSALLSLAADDTLADELTVLVLAIDGQHVGVAVDAVAERVETITRPLAGLLAGVRGIAGTTVMGDGRVLMVLDVRGLIQ